MPAVNPRTYHLSASAIAAFKACPTRFRLAYREGLRRDQDTDSQRAGTNWHAMHEVYAEALALHGTDEYALADVVEFLNKRYEVCPSFKTAEEWALERQILLTCFIGYQWYWQNDPVEVLASEVPFELPLHMPRTGLPLRTDEVLRVGKIDHIVRWQGAVCALERKSTSRGIGPESDYWDKAKKDTQVSMYALAFRDMRSGDVPVPLAREIIQSERYGNTLYDVWHKPTIKPTTLTQKETAEFIQSGEYHGQRFCVENAGPDPDEFRVNGDKVTIEPGKKGFAIRETIEMYGARLLDDIQTRPEFYFQRREIARTDAELHAFRKQLFSVYTSMKACSQNNAWIENEAQCRATFACPYIPVCYGPGADAVCNGQTTPQGFKRIFVDVTVNGEAVEE